MSYALRGYQTQAEDDVREAMRLARAVLLVLSTGAGKTVIFSDIARKAALKGKRILILAHRDTLIKQASAKLMEYGVPHGIIMAGFTQQRHHLVQVASVQTLIRRLDKMAHEFDLIIIDEAHLSAAKSYMTIVERFGKARVLGVTGSPVRLDSKGLGRAAGGLFDVMVTGISIKELIAQGFLVKPVVYASANRINLESVKTVAGEFDQHALADVMDKPVITGSAIAEYTRVCPGVPAVAWCVNVAHAEHVAGEFNAAGIPALALSGEDSATERTEALAALSSGRVKVVTFAMLLVEGVDCPAIGCVIMLRPTMSLASYLQVIGRGLRTIYAKGMPLETIEQRHAAILAGPKGGKCFVLDHADLWSRHGFADQEREWSLDGMKKKKGKKKDPNDVTIDLKQCPQCFVVHEPAPVCPQCGFVHPVASRGVEQVDGELKEITEEVQAQLRQQQRSAQAAAKSVEDMMRELGYSRTRAEAIVKARAEKAELRTALITDLQEWRRKTGQGVETFGLEYLSDLKQYKPKALKELRERFDAHCQAYTAGRIQHLRGDLFQPPSSQEAAF